MSKCDGTGACWDPPALENKAEQHNMSVEVKETIQNQTSWWESYCRGHWLKGIVTPRVQGNSHRCFDVHNEDGDLPESWP